MGTVRDALQLPGMRRIELGYGLSITGELAGTVALVVYALNSGGAGLVAAYAASRTVAGMGVALVLTGITSRVRRDRLLRWSTVVRIVFLGAAALLAAAGQPPAAVIAAGAASSALAGTYRPLQAAVLPWLVRTPAELAASNAVTAVMENSGALAGPLLAGGLLAMAAPAAAMAAAAGALAAAALSLLRLTVPDTPHLPGSGAGQVVRDVASGLAGLALAHAVRFWRLDRATPAPGPETGLLVTLPMFAPLPLAVTELLAAEVEPRQFPVGTVVIREGEPGDHFYLIVEGSATVSVHGAPRPSLRRGDCFGEIALLRDTPRTATVTAEQPLHTLALGREQFLTAVTGNPASSTAADELAAQRLSADAPDRNDGSART